MNRLANFIFLIVLMSSACGGKQLLSQKNILGDWIQVPNPPTSRKDRIVLEPPGFGNAAFSFYADGTCNNRTGYLKRTDSTSIYLGNRTKYRITNDSLYLLDPGSGQWQSHKIIKLTPDSLQFYLWDRLATFKRYKSKTYRTPDFDKIILATSGCYGNCQIVSIIINNDGRTIFNQSIYNTEKKTFLGRPSTAIISKENFKQLKDNFRETDFDSLKTRYAAGWTDDETISTTFVKNGKIFKTVSDYGRQAPRPFTWAYIPLRYLYQHTKLTPNSVPAFFPRFNEVRGSSFRKDGRIEPHSESETFLLFDYLRNGKQVDVRFNSRFKLHVELSDFPYYDINTDGRYYTFIVKGKPTTIDIGFNFYDVNVKNWRWRKIEEYD